MQTWGFTSNGLRTSASTFNSTGAQVESHTMEYLSGGKYLNGHKLKDTFWMKNANSAARCQTASATCVNEWTYDARDRLTQELRRRGTNKRASVYELYAHDGIKTLKVVDPGTNDTYEVGDSVKRDDGTRFYSGLRLDRIEKNNVVQAKYFYDGAGNLSCITASQGTKDQCAEYRGDDPNKDGNGAGEWFSGLLDFNDYDPQDRLQAHKTFGAGTKEATLDSSTVYDAFDRPVKVTETHDSDLATAGVDAKSRCTIFSYLGLSAQVGQEERRPAAAKATDCSSDPATTTRTKSYGYDANGQRLMMSEKVGSTTTEHTYAYDPQGSVSMLLNADGDVKASYGYLPYGESDDDGENPDPLTKEPSAPNPGEPMNAYRYTGKRTDTGSGTLDMGARRFSPGSGSFLQQDAYDDALGDMSLSTDPLSQNRYSLAGGNPISFVETDGHRVAPPDPGSPGQGTVWDEGSAKAVTKSLTGAPVVVEPDKGSVAPGNARPARDKFKLPSNFRGPRSGVVRIGLFIPHEAVGWPGGIRSHGDDRGFDPHFSADRTRATFRIDLRKRTVSVQVNPSCNADKSECWHASPLTKNGKNQVHVTPEGKNGFKISYELTNSRPQGAYALGTPSIDGDIHVQPGGKHGVDVRETADNYPAREAYLYEAGKAPQKLFRHGPGLLGPVGLFAGPQGS